MGLWTLVEGFLLLANALAILNEDRFLAPRGWSFQEYSGIKRNSFKGQILGLIYATQYLRVPLILLNLLCIVVKMVSGSDPQLDNRDDSRYAGYVNQSVLQMSYEVVAVW
ncbi:hypothetical protein SASPL_143161 [Salvia splendens]|uniref:Immediate early response 3-interacting protein 1-like n=1 Tax=Salvia splendens TaxID=180675 RepID=A0A8X8WLH5_SALSN|nr:hypothetical protein SASPL_143161 [Salvia splendens]